MGKILIIKMSALGDVVRTTPHIEAVLRHHEGEKIHLLTEPAHAGLFAHHPGLSTVVIDRKRFFGPSSKNGVSKWIRNEAFDAIYDFQGNRTSRDLVRKSGAKLTVGPHPDSVYYRHPPRGYSYTDDFPVNFIDFMDQILEAGGIGRAEPVTRFHVGEAEAGAVAEFIESRGLQKGGFAMIHAGSAANFPSKRWPLENFRALSELIEKAGVRVVWTGGPDDLKIHAELSETAGIDATSLFPPIGVYEMAKSARFAVTADSGPMYLSAAAGIPVFAFFGPTSGMRAHAQGQADRVLSNPEAACSPCFKKRCPKKFRHACLDPISPESVFSRILADGLL